MPNIRFYKKVTLTLVGGGYFFMVANKSRIIIINVIM